MAHKSGYKGKNSIAGNPRSVSIPANNKAIKVKPFSPPSKKAPRRMRRGG